VEIMEAANNVIDKLENTSLIKGRPVVRHGDPIEIVSKSDIADTAEDISQKIIDLKAKGHKTIAVICKTSEECELFLPLLRKADSDISIITGNEKE
jgi:DNA helicase-2/ATP-dependent DNA helicase PcrA